MEDTIGLFGNSKTVKFACFPGYRLEGSKNTTCKEDGTWTNPTPTCRGKQSCGIVLYGHSLSGFCTLNWIWRNDKPKF